MEQDTNYHLQQLNKQFRNLHKAIKEKDEEIASLREIVRAINSKPEGGYYAWMPYEENHLESLSGNVLIPADWLRQLIKNR